MRKTKFRQRGRRACVFALSTLLVAGTGTPAIAFADNNLTIQASASITDACWTLSLERDTFATGKAPTLNPTIASDGETLVEGQDYDLSKIERVLQSGSTESVDDEWTDGTYRATYEGKGSYSGTQSIDFSLHDAMSLDFATATLTDDRVIIPGDYTPEAVVTDADGQVVDPSQYEFSHYESTDGTNLGNTLPTQEGAYLAAFQGIDRHTGTVRATLTLVSENDLSCGLWTAELEGTRQHIPYTGHPVAIPTPTITRTTDRRALDATEYAYVGYVDPTDPSRTLNEGTPASIGEYEFVYEGQGDFSGTIAATGTIFEETDLALIGERGNITIDNIAYRGEMTCTDGTTRIMNVIRGNDDPEVSVSRDDGTKLRDTVDYDVVLTKGNPESKADVMSVDGKTTNQWSLDYKNVQKVDLEEYLAVFGLDVSVQGDSATIRPNEKATLRIDKRTLPTVTKNTDKAADDPIDLKFDEDMIVQFEDENGIVNLLEQNKDYTARVTSVNPDVCEGEVTFTVRLVGDDRPETMDLAAARLSMDRPSYVYTGSEIRPQVRVTVNGQGLDEGADYDIAYEDNVHTGTATVRIAGKGRCTGGNQTTFSIEQRDLSDATITTAKTSGYDGIAKRPEIRVTLDDRDLQKGRDYDVAYGQNVNAGTGIVTITGKGDYAGMAKKTFAIARQAIAVPQTRDHVFDGRNQLGANVPSTCFVAGTLRAAKVGTYRIRVKPDGNHCWPDGTTNAKTLTWRILKASNPMRVSTSKRTIRAKRLEKSSQAVRPIKVRGAVGRVNYKRLPKKSSKCLSINPRTGDVIVRQGTKPGTYKMRVRISAPGNSNYKSTRKTVTVKVRVR